MAAASGLPALSLDSQIWKQPVRADGSPAGPAVALTSDTSRRNSVPVISPDGTRVAYVSTRRGEQPNVWMMDINGREPLQLTADETPEHKPEWFRDGTRVAYVSRRNGISSIWAVDVTTRREEPLFDFAPGRPEPRVPGWLAELQLSPSLTQSGVLGDDAAGRPAHAVRVGHRSLRASRDHRRHGLGGLPGVVAGRAVCRRRGERGHVDAGGSHRRGVGRPADADARAGPDVGAQLVARMAGQLAVAALRDGIWSLRAIDVATGRQTTIHSSGSPRVFVRYPEWSPRGDAIVFERGEMRANVWTLALERPAPPTR